MKYFPWIAVVTVFVAAAAALSLVLLPAGGLPTIRPAEQWGGLAGALGRAVPPGPAAPDQRSSSQTPPLVLEQVSPIVRPDGLIEEGLGIEAPRGKFRPVLPRLTPVRLARDVTFGTAVENQKEIRLHILRGRSESVDQDHSLGWVRVGDLPPGPPGSTRVSIRFQILDGAIVITAFNPADGRALAIEPSKAPPGLDR